MSDQRSVLLPEIGYFIFKPFKLSAKFLAVAYDLLLQDAIAAVDATQDALLVTQLCVSDAYN
ncbi:hypothetical protein WM25_10680 [Burkholderia ubonensis]|nr:hypothetical protein WM25_10680 [Burkholderia ubonensis]